MALGPFSVSAFRQRFPDDVCVAYFTALRWPDGFFCPECGSGEAWLLECKPWTYECASCRRQTSIISGTAMHGSKLPPSIWFRAAFLIAMHPEGISARELQRRLGLGSYKTAWSLSNKLKKSLATQTINVAD